MKRIVLLFIFCLFLSCSKISSIKDKVIVNNNYSDQKKQVIKNFFEINYTLENINLVTSNEKDRCTVNYEIKNISNTSMYASLTLSFKSKGIYSKDAFILAGMLAPSKSTKGSYTFEKIPCDYLEELSFVY